MPARLYGILLRRQAEGVKPHGVQDVETLQTLISAVNIAGYISQWVSHMQARPGWIREHIQNIELRFTAVLCHLVSPVLRPELLPLSLNL